MATIRWEGDLTGRHSLAIVNRAFVRGLAGRFKVETGQQQPGPYRLPGNIAVRDQAVSRADITIRHSWPPVLRPADKGRLVWIQPWEYGAIPKSWAEFANEHVDEIWCYTNYVADCYQQGGVDPQKLHVVPLGVDLSTFKPVGRASEHPGKTVFLFVGGTIPRKGIDVLLDAYIAAFQYREDVVLLVKGFGSQTFYKNSGINDLIQAIEAARPAAPEVIYLDQDVSDGDLAALYRGAHVLVHPYRGEGFGLPVAEALACGTPVIVTAGGSTDDFVSDECSWKIPARRTTLNPYKLGVEPSHGETWWLEPDRDALIAALLNAADDPDALAERTRVARSQSDTMSWHTPVKRATERLNALLENTPSS